MIAAANTPENSADVRADMAALLDENRELRAVNRDLEVVAYAIAHDLRAPLRTIDGFAQLLADDLDQPVPDAAARDLAGIQSTVNRMQLMLMQWLSLVHKHHAELQRQVVDFSDLAESVAQDLRIANPERHVTVIVESNLTATADELLLRELLQNLIGNAWKFTKHRHDACIEIGAYCDREHTVYFVRDNGIGFPDSDRIRLFEPFVRLHDPALFVGSGVGLTIAQRIVERHGGRIWAHATPGKGATFKFILGSDAPRS